MSKEKGPIGWFKQCAKKMVRQGDISHMTALHKIAVAVGFKSWGELLNASDERLSEAIKLAKSLQSKGD